MLLKLLVVSVNTVVVAAVVVPIHVTTVEIVVVVATAAYQRPASSHRLVEFESETHICCGCFDLKLHSFEFVDVRLEEKIKSL